MHAEADVRCSMCLSQSPSREAVTLMTDLLEHRASSAILSFTFTRITSPHACILGKGWLGCRNIAKHCRGKLVSQPGSFAYLRSSNAKCTREKHMWEFFWPSVVFDDGRCTALWVWKHESTSCRVQHFSPTCQANVSQNANVRDVAAGAAGQVWISKRAFSKYIHACSLVQTKYHLCSFGQCMVSMIHRILGSLHHKSTCRTFSLSSHRLQDGSYISKLSFSSTPSRCLPGDEMSCE